MRKCDRIDIENLVKLMKKRCITIDISKETDYPTTKALLMRAAILIEEEILDRDANE